MMAGKGTQEKEVNFLTVLEHRLARPISQFLVLCIGFSVGTTALVTVVRSGAGGDVRCVGGDVPAKLSASLIVE
jgi:hypothetical protein